MSRTFKRTPAAQRFLKPNLESLEAREVLYAVSGNAWINPQLITIGFVPDGTIVSNDGGTPVASNLFATMNAKFGSAATWQNQILKAAQVWAQQTNINFRVITDNGADIGSGDYQQGDPNMADIRIGGYAFGNSAIAQAYLPPNVNNTSFSGDVQFNTTSNWVIGTNVSGTYDVFTVAAHEIGHALGLYHGASGSIMYTAYQGLRTALATDDINGIRAVTGWTNGTFTSPGYQGARLKDSYDTVSNGTFAAASTITSTINTTTKTALLQNLDITTTSDVDFYKFVVPAGLGGTLTVKAVSQDLSLLTPTLALYNGSQVQQGSTVTGTTYGATLTATMSVTAGQTYFIKVAGANTTAFGTGKYALALGFAGVATPAVPLPATQAANDPNPSAGGGLAVKVSYEVQVNTTTAGAQATFAESPQAVANDALGNYVVVWSSHGQDGSGYGVYARRYSVLGIPLGGEFRVSTTTSGDQMLGTVAMAPDGKFVVTWTAWGQDGSGWGVYAQRYNALGVAQGGEFRVNATTASDQGWSSIAMDPNGNFVVTWTSLGQDGSNYGVYAQRYNASGVAQGGEFRVNTYTANEQKFSTVAMDASGNFVITWSSWGQDGWGYGIYAKRYNAAGVVQGDEFRVNATTAIDQAHSTVGMDANGNFVVTWSSWGQDDGASWGVYFQQYTAAGVAQGGEVRVNTTVTSDQLWSSVAQDGNGNFLITWSSWGQDDGASWGVFARQYDATGIALGHEFQVNTTTSGDQRFSSIAMTAIGTVVVAWSGNGTGDIDGVSTQRYQLLNALSSLQPAVPHGYVPSGCGCTSCGAAVTAVVRPNADELTVVYGVPGHRASRSLGEGLFAGLRDWTAEATGDDDPVAEAEERVTRLDRETRPAVDAGGWVVDASQPEADEPAGDTFCVGTPAFGGYLWMPNL